MDTFYVGLWLDFILANGTYYKQIDGYASAMEEKGYFLFGDKDTFAIAWGWDDDYGKHI